MENNKKPAGLQKACDSIDKVVGESADLKCTKANQQDINRALAKMGGRFESENC